MKNIVHTIASFSFVTWLIGFLAYDMSRDFHYLLAVSVVTAVLRFIMEKRSNASESKA